MTTPFIFTRRQATNGTKVSYWMRWVLDHEKLVLWVVNMVWYDEDRSAVNDSCLSWSYLGWGITQGGTLVHNCILVMGRCELATPPHHEYYTWVQGGGGGVNQWRIQERGSTPLIAKTFSPSLPLPICSFVLTEALHNRLLSLHSVFNQVKAHHDLHFGPNLPGTCALKPNK